jgi:hypothetical protein
MRAAPLFILSALAGTLLGGCLSGQTGSPDCVPPTSCVCDPLFGAGAVLRVHVESLESGKLVAVIDEVFPSIFPNVADLKPGDRIGGPENVDPPCAYGTGPSVAPGSELLVLYSSGSRRDSVDREAALLDGFFGWTIAWTEPLVFGDSKELSQSELDVLQSPEACLEHFPASPAPPCNDTISSACSATQPRNATGALLTWPLPLALFALLYAARRQNAVRFARLRSARCAKIR